MIRGITNNTLSKIQAEVGELGIHFPIYSVYGQAAAEIIDMVDKSQEKYRYQSILPGTYLYNENLLPSRFYGKPIVIVEGVYDCLSLYQSGITAIAAIT